MVNIRTLLNLTRSSASYWALLGLADLHLALMSLIFCLTEPYFGLTWSYLALFGPYRALLGLFGPY